MNLLRDAFWDGYACTQTERELSTLLGHVRDGERECPWLPVFDEGTLPPARLAASVAKRRLDVLRAWVEGMRALVADVNLRRQMSAATSTAGRAS